MKTFLGMAGAALLLMALAGCTGEGFMPSTELDSYPDGYPYTPYGNPAYFGGPGFGYSSPFDFGDGGFGGFGGFGGDGDGDDD